MKAHMDTYLALVQVAFASQYLEVTYLCELST